MLRRSGRTAAVDRGSGGSGSSVGVGGDSAAAVSTQPRYNTRPSTQDRSAHTARLQSRRANAIKRVRRGAGGDNNNNIDSTVRGGAAGGDNNNNNIDDSVVEREDGNDNDMDGNGNAYGGVDAGGGGGGDNNRDRDKLVHSDGGDDAADIFYDAINHDEEAGGGNEAVGVVDEEAEEGGNEAVGVVDAVMENDGEDQGIVNGESIVDDIRVALGIFDGGGMFQFNTQFEPTAEASRPLICPHRNIDEFSKYIHCY